MRNAKTKCTNFTSLFFFYFRLVSTLLLRYLFDCTVLHFIEIHNMLLIYIYLLKKEVYVIL